MKTAVANLRVTPDFAEGSSPDNVLELASSRRFQKRNEELLDAFRRSRDPECLDSLVRLNQGLLHTVLRRYRNASEPYEDLLQAANLGLIKAVHGFDPDKGASFSSYAAAMIEGEVRHHLRDNVLIRQPRWLRGVRKRIDEASLILTRELKRPPHIRELSQAANISEEGILEIYRYSAMVDVCSLDGHSYSGDTGMIDTGAMRSRWRESFSLPLEDRIALEQALSTLNAIQKKVIYLLFYRDLTQSEAAGRLGLSQRKVSRESARALGVLKGALQRSIF